MLALDQLNGTYTPAFSSLATEFAQLFNSPEQRGAALCVMHEGEVVVDLWAGYSDRARTQPWQENTLVNLFSAGKPIISAAILLLVEQGKLALERPVADYWPAFAQAGKEQITVAQLLNHQAAIPAISHPLPAQALYDWPCMTQAVAAQAPWWTPSATHHGYAPMTFGWLTGELVRQVTGLMPGEFIQQSLCQPLALDLYLGLTAEQLTRVSDVSRLKTGGDNAAQQLITRLQQPQSLPHLAFNNPPGMLNQTNTPQWRTMQQPAANIHGTARALASFYHALLSGQLLEPASLANMCHQHSVGLDRTLGLATRFGLGVLLDQTQPATARFNLFANSFGHPGAGGTLGCANAAKNVTFAFVTNSLGPYVLMDPRAQRLTHKVTELLS
ncbi:beta-lactamase family protein [Thiopseudomonas alkaliphila]|uniref:Beta-lactamase family protein n=1 Tax=Thiopseudomonas alkaliphila TaxID=1697053 RepID=A0AAW7DWH0_9GAMM|nr:serine hydrolase domain-containing protein [Thiopseudomonas alkaliphila]MDM1697013.1 beta-lactamase family protein [Thiopseudomonas alkaliphila]